VLSTVKPVRMLRLMPSEIDTEARLDEIARATLELAETQGAPAVTIRAVAARMGGSTTVVTKFVPSRAALVRNALRFMRRRWDGELGSLLGDLEGEPHLRAFADWMFDTEPGDAAFRRLWIEIVAKEGEGSVALLDTRDEAREERESIHEAFAQAGVEAEPWLLDLFFLAARGYYVSTVEDPADWPAERAQAAINGLLDLVAGRRRGTHS
jgi:AcrR family transcriptional regulator